MRHERCGRLTLAPGGHEVFWRRFGQARETLLVLHGGPGASHDYLLGLAGLAGPELEVVFYDQLGGGRSDRPSDDSLWRLDRFVDELEQVRAGLALGSVHLLGQSWGGMLALQYALEHPGRVGSLILSNTGPSAASVVAGMATLRASLPPQTLASLLAHEARGEWESPQYKAAVEQLYIRHLRRSTPFEPETALAEYRRLVEPLMEDLGPAYRVMWGPNEFVCSGSLQDWDVSERLGEIQAPALVLCGAHDEITPEVHRQMAEALPAAQLVIFGQSSHIITLEAEAPAYLSVIAGFVRQASIAADKARGAR